jgi:porin
MNTKTIGYLGATLICLATISQAAETISNSTISPLLSTDEVESQISLDRKVDPLYESRLFSGVKQWREGVAERTGFNWSLDYSALYMSVNTSPGEDEAAGGMVRFFGYWDLVNRIQRCRPFRQVSDLD